jgi:hypothetical protein
MHLRLLCANRGHHYRGPNCCSADWPGFMVDYKSLSCPESTTAAADQLGRSRMRR